MPEIRSRISSSSSTTRISDAISDPFLLILTTFLTQTLLNEGEGQRDLRTVTTFRISQGDLTAMVFHDLSHNRQAQPGTFCPGGDIGFRQTVAMFGWQPDAIVADLERECQAVGLERDRDPAGRFVAPRLPCRDT